MTAALRKIFQQFNRGRNHETKQAYDKNVLPAPAIKVSTYAHLGVEQPNDKDMLTHSV
jgi:hypothetical protein